VLGELADVGLGEYTTPALLLSRLLKAEKAVLPSGAVSAGGALCCSHCAVHVLVIIGDQNSKVVLLS